MKKLEKESDLIDIQIKYYKEKVLMLTGIES